ncbi:hypothetical protein BS78_03G305200 [Paspalum vaginatum]|nr:hypothetical protein BS78_03G305200 [Paspalum vaginatum]
MSGAPNAESEGFTCCALLMCLHLPGLSTKKKPEEAIGTNPPPAEMAPAPGQPTEQQQPPTRAASAEKPSCASLYSGNNIVFDFAVEDGEQGAGAARAIQFQGYCPSPCFDLPVELIRPGERFGVAAAGSGAPVTAAFVLGDDQRGAGALKKMASCLAPGAEANSEPRPPHLLRFLSASGRSSVPRPPVMPSRTAPPGKAVHRDCELGGSVMVPACKE